MRAWLSLGSNIDREAHLRGGLDALHEQFGELLVSPVYESVAVGFEGPAFYNLAAGLESDLSPGELVRALRAIEDRFGRDRSQPRFSNRTLDIDLLSFGDLEGEFDGIVLPRPETFRQAFVLGPLADIAATETLPGQQRPLADLWQAMAPNTLKRTPFTWIPGRNPV